MFDFNTLPELFKHIEANVKTPSYLNYRNNNKWESVSSEEFVQTVLYLSRAFKSAGVDKVCTSIN